MEKPFSSATFLFFLLIFPLNLLHSTSLRSESEGFLLPSFFDIRIFSENTEIQPGTSWEEVWRFEGTGTLAVGVRRKPWLLADLGVNAITEFGGGAKIQPFLRAGISGERVEFLLGRISPLNLGESWITYRSGFRSDLWGVKGQLLLPWIFGGISLDRETSVSYGIPERFRVHGVSGIGGFLPLNLRYEWVIDHGGGFDTPRYALLRDGAPTFQEFAGILHLRLTFLDPLYFQVSAGRSWGKVEFTPAEGRIFASEIGWDWRNENLSLLLQATGFFRDHDFILHRGLPWLEQEGEGIERTLWIRGNLRFLFSGGFFIDSEVGELFRFTPRTTYWNFTFLMVGYRFDPDLP